MNRAMKTGPDEIRTRAREALRLYEHCTLCGHECGLDRRTTRGICGESSEMRIAAALIHRGEEPFISGGAGAGTIFFSGCSMSCVFCQNYQISRSELGELHTSSSLAQIMLNLQGKGCGSIDLVTPTHFLPSIIEALAEAVEGGLSIPIVYNTSAFDSMEALTFMDGLVDIYLPDLKYMEPETASESSGVPSYPEVAKKSIIEMFRQVGHLRLDEHGAAISGLIVRHLVLPGRIENTERCLRWLADNIGNRTVLSLMSQYSPPRELRLNPPFDRTIRSTEYDKAVDIALSLGFENALIQELDSRMEWIPDFSDDEPFGSSRDPE